MPDRLTIHRELVNHLLGTIQFTRKCLDPAYLVDHQLSSPGRLAAGAHCTLRGSRCAAGYFLGGCRKLGHGCCDLFQPVPLHDHGGGAITGYSLDHTGFLVHPINRVTNLSEQCPNLTANTVQRLTKTAGFVLALTGDGYRHVAISNPAEGIPKFVDTSASGNIETGVKIKNQQQNGELRS